MAFDLIEYVKSLNIAVGQSVRTDCPNCGGGMSFSATRQNSTTYLWHCFRNSCKLRGGASLPSTIDDVRLRAMRIKKSINSSKEFEIPPSFVSVWNNVDAVRYLTDNNSLRAARSGRVDVRYDVAQRRVVFLIHEKGKVVGAIGRLLGKSNGIPKWYKYESDITRPFICPPERESDGGTAVVVEDCASACAVSSVSTGISLNGTLLLPEYIPILARFDSILIALDRDATVKGIEIYSFLRFFQKTRLVLLDRDLKYESKEDDLKRILQMA